MSILNVNQIQPVGSGQTVTISATNISAGSATVTAGTFSGGVTVTSGNLTGITSVSTSNLTVNGNAYPATGSLSNRNKIINGAMLVDQRNAGASVTAPNNAYTLDRYQTFTETSDGVFTIQQVADAPAGFINSAEITVTTADASIGAAQRYLFAQNIEGFNVADLGFGAAGAATVTLSFWVKSSITGTFGAALVNSGFNRSYPFNYTINSADTWEYKTITIPGDTTGTWLTNNGLGIRLIFGIGVGSDNSGTANTWAASNFYQPTGSVNLISTLNATWNITGVQLEVGSVATPFEHRSFGQELLLCSRYFQKSYSYEDVPGTVTSGNRGNDFTYLMGGSTSPHINLKFNPEMRITPNITAYSTATANTTGVLTASSTDYAVGTNVIVNSAKNFLLFATGVTAADDCYVAWTANAEL